MRGDRARSALAGTRFADLRWSDETGSTNRDLLDLASSGAPEGLVVLTDHQTAGRGRLDRAWHAPAGGSLLLSVLFRPLLPVGDTHLLTTAVGVSAAEACREVAWVPAQLKWPNDLVYREKPAGPVRKLGGILAESILDSDRVEAVVVGIGLNVNWPADPPAELADIASALNWLAGNEIDRDELLIGILQRLDHWYGEATDESGDGRKRLMHRARNLSATLGQRVRADLGGTQIEGLAVGLTDDGALAIDVDAGTGGEVERRHVIAGDVVHLHRLS